MKRQAKPSTKQQPKLTKDDLVYKVSRWNKMQYETERDTNTDLMKKEAAGGQRHQQFPNFQREVFSRLINPMTKKLDEPAPGSEWAQAFHQMADQVAEFGQLQDRCKGDPMWSGMATCTVAQSVVAKMKPQESNEDIQELQAQVDALKDLQDQGINVGDRMQQAQQALQQAQQQAQQLAQGLDPAMIRQAFRKGAEAAQDQIDNMQKAMNALSWGDGPGQPQSNKNMQQKRDLMQKLNNSTKLKDIAELAGRLRRVAAQKQRTKSDFAREEINSVEQGNDFARLLPSEKLNLMGSEEQELLFFSRYTDGKCLQYSLKGKEEQGRGPIIICCDESGSMSGAPDTWAKAASLALLEVAQRQKRSWVFIHFSSRVTKIHKVEAGKVDQGELINCMEHFSGGGTSFELPLREAIKQVEDEGSMKEADILFITDGAARTTPHFNQWLTDKCDDLECSIYSILVNGAQAGQDMQHWSEAIYNLEDLLDGGKDKDDFEDFVFSM